MCTICFSSAQVVPLGALYLRARFVAARERREAAVIPVALAPSEHDGAEVRLPEPRRETQPALDGQTHPVRELSLAGRS